jgi:hypothetical protein
MEVFAKILAQKAKLNVKGVQSSLIFRLFQEAMQILTFFPVEIKHISGISNLWHTTIP